MSEETKSSYLNFATVLSIGTIAMYILGWIYWKLFFTELNISFSIVDLTFEKIISTTWTLIIIVIIGFGSTFLQTIRPKDEAWDVVTVIFILAVSFAISIYTLTKYDYHFYILFSVFVIYAIIQTILKQKKVEVPYVKQVTIRIIVAVAIYLFSLFYYGNEGKKEARKILNNYESDAEITLKNNEHIQAKFVTKTEKIYFFLIENKNCKREILAINQDEIIKILMPVK